MTIDCHPSAAGKPPGQQGSAAVPLQAAGCPHCPAPRTHCPQVFREDAGAWVVAPMHSVVHNLSSVALAADAELRAAGQRPDKLGDAGDQLRKCFSVSLQAPGGAAAAAARGRWRCAALEGHAGTTGAAPSPHTWLLPPPAVAGRLQATRTRSWRRWTL